MRRLCALVLAAAVVSSCGGGSKSPTSPSNEGSAPPASAPAPAPAAATISGIVQAGAVSAILAVSFSAALTGVTVSIAGTSISSPVDAAGRFTLANVPPGDIGIRVSGPGIDATVPLAQVQPSQRIDLVIVVAGNSGAFDSEMRQGSGEAELEGRVEALPPATAAQTFRLAGRVVNTDSSTEFVQGSLKRGFADLQVGMRVHVKGRMAGDSVAATSVLIRDVSTSPGPGNGPAAEVSGAIDSLSGSASAFQFKIGSRVVKGGSATAFVGSSNRPASFAELTNGSLVEVSGQQGDGFIQATRIHVEDKDAGGGEVSLRGTLTAIAGAKPNLVLTVGSTTVRTTGATEVKQHGKAVSLDALKPGQSLEVEGTRQADGSIVAKTMSIED